MADAKTESPELARLKEIEANLIAKGKTIEGRDANALARQSIDINEQKTRNQSQLSEVRKEIARLSK